MDIISVRESIKQLICEKKEEQLKHFLKQETVKKLIIANAWEIVPDLCEFLCDEREWQSPNIMQSIEDILLTLSEKCAPKELIVLLTEQLKEQNHALFQALVIPVQRCLTRITSNKGHSLALVLKSFDDYIASLPLPKEHNLEGKERLLLDLDENVQHIVTVVQCFLDFLSPLVANQAWNVEDNERIKTRSAKQLHDLTVSLIQVLNYPLAFLDLSHDVVISNSATKSSSRVCAEMVVELLSRLHPNLFKAITGILEKNEKARAKERQKSLSGDYDSADEINTVPLLGLSTLSYLLFSEKLSMERFPCIYSYQFLFEFNLPFLLCFLQRPELLVIRKGLSLIGALFRHMAPNTWSLNFLECTNLLELIKSLVFVASTVKINEVNEYALRVLSTLLKMFETDGRVKLLQYLLTISPRGRVIGYVITMLTNEIGNALNNKSCGFFGKAINNLLMLVFALPKGETTDLLDHSDRIMGALNLLRFLLLQDGVSENVTGIWSLVPLIKQKYIQVLGAGINLSRAHYELELKTVRETRSDSHKNDPQLLTKREQIAVMHMAINTFNKMEGILGKVTELIEHQKKTVPDNSMLELAKSM